MASTVEPQEVNYFEKELESYKADEEKPKEDKKLARIYGQELRLQEHGEDNRKYTMENPSDDSEGDEYNLTEDQVRALEELDNLKNDMEMTGLNEDPPPYDVKERLKLLNEEFKNDPTPVEKQKDSKVVFKQNLVDLVVPPPAESDGDEDHSNSPMLTKSQLQPSDDKVDDHSKSITVSRKLNTTKQDSVLIEQEGQFMLVNANDVQARDLDYTLGHDNETESENKLEKNKTKLQPLPPVRARPSTGNSNRRNVRNTSVKQRPQSAQVSSNSSASYNSPYALSLQAKKVMEERKKALEKQKQDEDRRKKEEEENKEKENHEAFEFWLKQKRESDRKKRIQEEENRKKNSKEDKQQIKDFEENKELTSYDILYYKHDMDEQSENGEAFKGWLKEKSAQFKREKLLKRREDQEKMESYYYHSREDCDKAYKQWLKQKATEARKARALERQKAKLQRLAAKRARQTLSLSQSNQESQCRYVDYYGYRY